MGARRMTEQEQKELDELIRRCIDLNLLARGINSRSDGTPIEWGTPDKGFQESMRRFKEMQDRGELP